MQDKEDLNKRKVSTVTAVVIEAFQRPKPPGVNPLGAFQVGVIAIESTEMSFWGTAPVWAVNLGNEYFFSPQKHSFT